jgi:hypothetical protein
MIKAILFDWGDTVMRVFSQFHGAMADWPKVEAIPGIQDACANLAQRFDLHMATNASESGPAKIYAALARVEMDKYFTRIFTAHDLGISKPSTAFYERILSDLGLSASEVLMVGDDFNADILGPNNAGVRSVWFVPYGLTTIRQIPVQSGEIHSMAELPGIVDDLIASPLPTISECDTLLRTYSNNPNLLRHVTMVALVAYLVAELCVENGYSVNPILTHRGGLLHDLDKLICLKTNMEHGQETNRILQTSGYSKLGRIALSHLTFTLLDPDQAPSTLEAKIVYFSDKLVNGDQIVGIKARLANLKDRYPEDRESFELCEPLIYNLQNEILSIMKLDETRLIEFLKRRISLME